VENAVTNLPDDVIKRDGSAGILKAITAMISGGGRKERAIGSEDVEADKAGFFSNGNHGMKYMLVESLSDTNMEIGKCGFTRTEGI
jgi:hypothetical protein